MDAAINGPDIDRSALMIDKQNDFVHPNGYLAHLAQQMTGRGIDVPFLTGCIPNVRRFKCVPSCREVGDLRHARGEA